MTLDEWVGSLGRVGEAVVLGRTRAFAANELDQCTAVKQRAPGVYWAPRLAGYVQVHAIGMLEPTTSFVRLDGVFVCPGTFTQMGPSEAKSADQALQQWSARLKPAAVLVKGTW